MRHLSLRLKLFMVIGLLSAVAVTVAGIGLWKLSGMNDRLNTVVEISAKRIELAGEINQELLAIHRAEKNVILASSQEEMEGYIQNIKERRESMSKLREDFRLLTDEEGKQKIDNFAKKWEEFLTVHDKVIQHTLKNSNVVAKAISANEGREAFERAERHIRNYMLQVAGEKRILAADVLTDAYVIHRAEKNVILETDEEKMNQYESEAETSRNSISNGLRKLISGSSASEQQILSNFEQEWTRFIKLHQRVIKTSKENSNSIAFQLSTGKGREALDQAEAILADIINKNKSEMIRDKKLSDENYDAAFWLMVIASLSGIMIGLLFGYSIVQGVTKVLKQVFGGLKKCSTDELEGASETLHQIMSSLGDGSEQVASASNQVSTASQSLAEGANEQAASLEETSSSLEEMASMTQQNDSNAQEVNNLMVKSNELINQCKSSMNRLGQAIEDIKSSSDETAKIIKTIDEIAFQTNLLALNAAVEAARAGDAGRGFAVVADEVGNLAQRAGEAARNTGALIEQSVKNSERGVEVAQETDKALDTVIQSSQKVAGLIAEIAASSKEQSQGISQINQAVTQLDSVTQQNSSSAEESAAASEELNAQADQLLQLVQDLEALVGSGNTSGNSRKHNSLVRKKATTRTSSSVVPIRSEKKAVKSQSNHAIKTELKRTLDAEAEKALPLDSNDEKEVVGF